MRARWRFLFAVSSSVVIADQATKFLAVERLTPGMAQAHFESSDRRLDAAARDEVIDGLGFWTKLGYFYGAIETPCRKRGAFCEPHHVIPGFFAFRYVENPGAAWGLLSRTDERIRIPFFFVVSVAAIGFILLFFRRVRDDQRLLLLALPLVLGGAIGNFIDRLHLSYVIDFIDWYVGRHHWPTFNLADAAISTGVGLLVLDAVRDAMKGRHEDRDALKEVPRAAPEE